MRAVMRGRAGMALAFILGLVIATAGSATAARLITGRQIKDGSIAQRDLTKGVRGLIAKAGTPGPRGPQGAAGLSNGPAGGDLTGSYPDPTLRPATQVRLREQPGPTCLVTFDILCGDDAGSWTAASGGSFAPPSYFVEPGGVIQFQGAVQQVGAGFQNAVAQGGLLFYLPPGRRPAGSLRFPVVRVKAPKEAGFVLVGDNGEVSLKVPSGERAEGDQFDLSSVRFHAAGAPG